MLQLVIEDDATKLAAPVVNAIRLLLIHPVDGGVMGELGGLHQAGVETLRFAVYLATLRFQESLAAIGEHGDPQCSPSRRAERMPLDQLLPSQVAELVLSTIVVAEVAAASQVGLFDGSETPDLAERFELGPLEPKDLAPV